MTVYLIHARTEPNLLILLEVIAVIARLDTLEATVKQVNNKLRISNSEKLGVRDWSKSIGGGGEGGPEHLEMWLIKNTLPTPSLRHKND